MSKLNRFFILYIVITLSIHLSKGARLKDKADGLSTDTVAKLRQEIAELKTTAEAVGQIRHELLQQRNELDAMKQILQKGERDSAASPDQHKRTLPSRKVSPMKREQEIAMQQEEVQEQPEVTQIRQQETHILQELYKVIDLQRDELNKQRNELVRQNSILDRMQRRIDSQNEIIKDLTQQYAADYMNLGMDYVDDLLTSDGIPSEKDPVKVVEKRLSHPYDPYARYTRFTCVSGTFSLYCQADETINVTSAYYGQHHGCMEGCCTPHPTDDCTEYVPDSRPSDWLALLAACNNKSTCEYQYRGSTFIGGCAINVTADFMTVYYSCLPEDWANAVGFTAYATVHRYYEPGDLLKFDAMISNIGLHYNQDSSIFICPQPGVYVFSINPVTRRNETIEVSLYLESVHLCRTVAQNNNAAASLFVIECLAGQRVWAQTPTDGSMQGFQYSTFSGFLLYSY